ncbi:hypothetical protein QN277_020941 [Acacia crassicarpa]|uniref:Uncharacterized protein n=1 Tax=Acacia crassicarpa TaxID=499986 RepID=A0AAE1KDT9_9FABA|nr:hypothetical protein QN277_020941 [Acacia crassicarpa]
MAQDRYALLERPCPISRSTWPKIQRVARHLRSREAFAKYYTPKMVSLGPIHHGEPHLQLGEQYKLMWASMYVQGNRNQAQRLHREIIVNIKDLKDLYTLDALGHFNDDELAWMLFVDGCALLQILKHPDILHPEPLKAKVDQMALVRQDALLLENQLPFRVLQLLSDLPDDHTLIKDVDTFLLCHHFSPDQKPKPKKGAKEGDQCEIDIESDSLPNPVHLLDELRKKVLHDFRPRHDQESIGSGQITYRNLKELKEAGIQVKRSKSKSPIDITFSSYCCRGELKLPDIIVDETIAPTYLNLMAYEVCPDFDNQYEISSYVEFLDSLIDHPDDVKELRKARVLHNGLGSDQEVAELFNVISTDLVPNAAIYASLRDEIEKHYQKKYKTWFALAYNTYFSNPWSIIAFIAASVAILLTFVQTWFAAFPAH